MSNDVSGPRPQQVTMGGLVAAVAAVLVILSCYQSIENLHSIDVRTSIEDFLRNGVGRSLSMSVAQVQTVMRIVLMVAAATAAIAGVLGVYVLQREKGARIGLSVAAVVLLITVPITGGIALFVVAGAGMLWTPPARDWFAGRPPRERVAPPRRPLPGPPPPRAAWRDLPPPAGRPAPLAPPAPVAPAQPGQERPPTANDPRGTQGYPPPAYAAPLQGYHERQTVAGTDRRPSTVVIAAALTWVFAGVTLLGVALLMVVLASNSTSILDAADKNSRVRAAGLSHSTIVAGLWAVCVILAVLAVAGCVFAYFLYQRQAWARIALIATIGIGLVLSLGSLPISVAHVVAMTITAVLLFRTPTNDWLRRKQPGPPPTPPTVW